MTRAEMTLAAMADGGLLGAVYEPCNLDGFGERAELLMLARVYGYLACYAEDKAKAMDLRTQGDIDAALHYERAAEANYKRLPEWARW